MEAIFAILALAIVVEALIEVGKGVFPFNTPHWLWPLVGVALGVSLCWLTNSDLLTIVGVEKEASHMGASVTGVLISRGASFIHDLWDRIRGEKN